MPGVAASALSGTPLVARPLLSTFTNNKRCVKSKTSNATAPSSSSRSRRRSSSRRNNNNNNNNVTHCAIHESSADAPTSAGDDDGGEWAEDGENCPITPRQIVNGQELPLFEDVSTAHFRIRSGVVRTRCTKSKSLSAITGMNIFIKHEWEQATGSFKERGARNSLLALSPEQRKRGVVAASAGRCPSGPPLTTPTITLNDTKPPAS